MRFGNEAGNAKSFGGQGRTMSWNVEIAFATTIEKNCRSIGQNHMSRGGVRLDR
ncbi:hypothetical protein RISK_000988 [Rhodopirellula islandica]|uniref:Uncharacterized protein n=1 Tax=Rhodopirellula islandica TaxID=595434 RepID=A0A0J1BL08_RHOIS|nr:hypothetical protein RISK_000988 [Rhodopirellula islandica]